jgi:hypothetical protein
MPAGPPDSGLKRPDCRPGIRPSVDDPPQPRPGFCLEIVLELSDNCLDYHEKQACFLSDILSEIIFFIWFSCLKISSDFHFKAEFQIKGRFLGIPGTPNRGQIVSATHCEDIRTMWRLAFPGLAFQPGVIPNFLPAAVSRFAHRFCRRAFVFSLLLLYLRH